MTVEIRTFGPGDWRAYRDTRLSALKDAPDAFGTTLAESKTYPDAKWQARLAAINPLLDLPLGAWEKSTAVGMAWSRTDPDDPLRKIVNQMWVAPAARGSGAGQALLDACIAWARQGGARDIELAVTEGNGSARRLYERLGFEPFGEPEPLREGSSLRVQPMLLGL